MLADKPAREDLVSQLKEMGLTMYEASSYVSLLFQWPASATTLCGKTGIPDTKIYHVLESLQKKGMVAVQHGRPTLFKPLPPKEALANLKRSMQQEFAEKGARLELLASKIEPLYEKSSGSEEIELAYVVKGFDNLVNRMKSLIDSAQGEIVLFVPAQHIFAALRESLLSARERGIRIELAVAPTLRRVVRSTAFSGYKVLTESCQNCWAMIRDNRVLLTATGWQLENCSGLLTQDTTLIAMCRSWLTNPSCCF